MVIVGLGNPGKEYEKTPHNVGFMMIDEIARVNKLEFRLEKKHEAMIATGMICGKKCHLIKPLTYMNLSGNAVRSFVEYYNIPLDEVLVIFDDMDLPLGKLRIRKSGSAGGHKGMKSIIENLKTNDICRIRVGIDKPKEGMDVINFVLHKLSKEEMNTLVETISKAPEMIDVTIKNGINYMMNIYNGK